ncbi:hydrogenase maturation protease [Streptomyces sp. TR06-5]|uniref:hydrogenase maturation protease n=1 Tax=Streptomyces sp. TR06-5 TaxID=3385976 RepID=UPI00399F13A9
MAVIGIGNTFRRDDGVGWAVVAHLRERSVRWEAPPVLARSDGDPGRLIALWEDTALTVVVDACFPRSATPGRVHRWCAVSLTAALHSAAAGRHSTHGFGPAEALRLGDALGRRPERLVVYGVEGADRSLGTGLTRAVAARVPELARRIEAEIRHHQASAAGRERRGAARDDTPRPLGDPEDT